MTQHFTAVLRPNQCPLDWSKCKHTASVERWRGASPHSVSMSPLCLLRVRGEEGRFPPPMTHPSPSGLAQRSGAAGRSRAGAWEDRLSRSGPGLIPASGPTAGERAALSHLWHRSSCSWGHADRGLCTLARCPLSSSQSSPHWCLVVYISRIWSESRRVNQSCLTLCDPMDCSPPGSSVHGIFQARTLDWVANPFSIPSPGDLPNPGIEPESPALQADSLWSEPPGKLWLNKFPPNYRYSWTVVAILILSPSLLNKLSRATRLRRAPSLEKVKQWS